MTWSDELYRIYGLDPQKGPIDMAMVREMIHTEDREHVFRKAEEQFVVACTLRQNIVSIVPTVRCAQYKVSALLSETHRDERMKCLVRFRRPGQGRQHR